MHLLLILHPKCLRFAFYRKTHSRFDFLKLRLMISRFLFEYLIEDSPFVWKLCHLLPLKYYTAIINIIKKLSTNTKIIRLYKKSW